MDKEEINRIKQYYSITEEEFKEMYKKIRMLTFQEDKPNLKEKPIAIFTGGQPGAGKGALIIQTKKEFEINHKSLLIFDLDRYRAFYKNAIEIALKYPELYAEITGKVAGKIMEMLSEEAIEKGYNFILEGTMGKSVFTLDVLQKKRTDYDIVAKLMAVSKEESLLSIVERYIEMKKDMGIGRMTKFENHNSKYENFPNVVKTLETRDVEVEVYERSHDVLVPKLIYKTSGKNKRYASVAEAIATGRKHSYDQCFNTMEERVQNIQKDLQEFGEIGKYRKEIDELMDMVERNCKIEKEEERC